MRPSAASRRSSTCVVAMSGRVLMTSTGRPRTVVRTGRPCATASSICFRKRERKSLNTGDLPRNRECSEFALPHLLEEMLALDIRVLVSRGWKRLVEFPTRAGLRELFGAGGILPDQLRELLLVHRVLVQ